jgi:outer membrane receptor protein involved in Fe transport
VIAGLSGVMLGFGAGTAAQDEGEIEEIEVTGQRIQRSGFTAPTPVTVINREAIDDLGLINVGDVVKELPQNNPEVSATNTSQGSINGYVTDANIGAELANLRGLNVAFGTRTLTLVDGHRFVPSTNGGSVDLALIPSNLVRRVEVVTGGASAAYGSDAVAGVVNVVLDRELEGIRGQADFGQSFRGDGEDYHVGLGAGTSLFDGRAHLVVGGEWADSKAVGQCTATRGYCEPYAIFQSEGPFAATNPEYVLVDNAVAIPQLAGGIISVTRAIDPPGPAPLNPFTAEGNFANIPAAFRAKRFNDAGTALVDWPIGDFVDDAALLMAGGDGPAPDLGVLTRVPVKRHALYSRFQYDLTEQVQGFVEASYGRREASNSQVGGRNSWAGVGFAGILIKPDNVYLPAGVGAQMTASGLTGLYVTKHNAAVPEQFLPESSTDNRTYRVVVGLEGDLDRHWLADRSWQWDVYYTYGLNDQKQRLRNLPRNTPTASNDSGLDPDGTQFGFTSGPLANGSYPVVDDRGIYGVSNFDLAVDAIAGANGAPACRINAAPTAAQQAILAAHPEIAALVAGCRPINMFGTGNIDPAAWEWLLGTQTEDYDFTQHVVGANIQTEVADLWAGPLTLALGGEYRFEDGETLHNAPVQYWTPDYGGDFLGKQTVLEGYLEADLTLLKDVLLVREFNVNGAVRRTHTKVEDNTPNTSTPDSKTFDFTTWKLSAVWDVTDQFRLRGTRSRDIRAPSFRELFFPGRPTPDWTIGVTNPWITPNPAGPWVNDPGGADLPRNGGGNPDLERETADTTTVGFVFQPGGFAEGLRLSADWYQIKLKNGIANVYTNGIITSCYLSDGTSPLCDRIIPVDPSETAATGITDFEAIITGSQNVANFTVEGIDFEAAYRLELGEWFDGAPGVLDFRLLASYMDKLLVESDLRGTLFGRRQLLAEDGTNYAGQVGAGGVDDVASFSESPKWQGSASVGYSAGPLRTMLQARYVGPAHLYNDLIDPSDPGWGLGVPNTLNVENHVGSYWTFTLSGSYSFGEHIELFAVIDNLFDRDPIIAPPLTTGAVVSGGGASITNPVFYDMIGRRFRVGLRFNY